jgi:hypothetical protein
MARLFRLLTAATVVGFSVSAAGAQTAVNIVAEGSQQRWRGVEAGSAAGTSLDRGAISAGDNRGDLIIGAPSDSSMPGRVYIIVGGPVRTGELMLSKADIVVTGAVAGDRFGAATANANIISLEDSGPRDLVVGAPQALGGAGAVYLFKGAIPLGARLSTADAELRILGRPGEHLGTSLATADLNGDGRREILIGATGAVPTDARIYVINGSASLDVSSTVTLDLSSARASSEIRGTGIGGTIAAGDMTGDGRSDVLISAPYESASVGKVYLIQGRAEGLPSVMTLPQDATAVFSGNAPDDLAGFSLRVLDLDGDGKRDVAVGAPGADPLGRIDAGAVYFLWGGSDLATKSLAAADAVLQGPAAGYRVGSMLTSGDVNRDQPDDLVILAPGARGGSGELLVFYGGARSKRGGVLDLAVATDRRLYAEPTPGALSMAQVFEVSGEGARDIIAAAPTADLSDASDAGLVYFSTSPSLVLDVSPGPPHVIERRSTSGTITVKNRGTGSLTWSATSDRDWLIVSPSSGSSTFASPQLVTYTTATTLAPGTYHGTITIRSTSADVEMFLRVFVDIVVTACSASPTSSDFDCDGRADYAVFRPSTGEWWVSESSMNNATYIKKGWGTDGDVPVSGDFDGDRRADIAVYRPSTGYWWILLSSTDFQTYISQGWGGPDFIPVPGDYDGDGKTDVAVWRPSTGVWWILRSSTNNASYFTAGWGDASFVPVPADYDGDGRTDIAVWRPSTGVWWILKSSSNYTEYVSKGWGDSTFTPVQGDFDGDRRADIAVWNPTTGVWWILTSSSGYSSYFTRGWGDSTFTPVPADFDGDGMTDIAVWRASTGMWWVLQSSAGFNGYVSFGWGTSGDRAISPR